MAEFLYSDLVVLPTNLYECLVGQIQRIFFFCPGTWASPQFVQSAGAAQLSPTGEIDGNSSAGVWGYNHWVVLETVWTEWGHAWGIAT